MIQRIQTIWLFLAALISSFLLLDWYTGYVFHANVVGSAIALQQLKVTNHFPTMIIAVIMVILPLLAIFMYRNRKRQKTMAFVGILSCLSFIGVNLMRINNFRTLNPVRNDEAYDAGSILPLVVIVLLILALRGINKDEKLIKSLDRLR